MKKYIYISGIASANLMFVGAMCKVMHWPGAGVLLTLCIVVFCLFFLPFALYNAYQNSSPKKYKTLYIVSYIVFSIVFIGALFKIQHWPGAGWLMIIGIPLPMVLFLPVYLIQTRKDKKYSIVNFMGIMFGMVFLAVFSAMLSISIGSNVLTRLDNQFKYNENIISIIDTDLINSTNHKNVQEKADDICLFIEKLTNEMLVASAIDVNDIKNTDFRNLDDHKIPNHVLNNENKPLTELKNKIIDFKQAIMSSNSASEELKELSNKILNIDDNIENGKDHKMSWEDYYFNNYNLTVSLNVLSRVERNVKFIEQEIITAR